MKWYSLSPLILQKLIWIPTRFTLKFFGHLKIEGLEHLEDIQTNVIFACNHASELDPFFVPASLPFFSRFSPLFYPTRERSFYSESGWRQLFYGGFFFRMWGGYPAYVGLKDYEKALYRHIKIIEEGGSFCVFPEGKTTKDGNLLPAKGGIAYLAERTDRPIIPVAIIGTYDIGPGEFFSRKRHMKITFGKPIYTKELVSNYMNLSGEDHFSKYKDMAQHTMIRIEDLMKG